MFPPEPHLDLVTLVLHGNHWDLDTLLYTWASPGPGDCGPTWASPGRGDWFPQGPHLVLVTQILIGASWDLVSQFHIGASSGPSDSGPPLGLTRSWGHWSSTGPQQDLVNLLLT